MFFVGTAASDGRVNISPKGVDSLRVLGDNRVVWLSLTGSGNETAAHLLENHRMTLMFCAFEESPLILRLFGYAKLFIPETRNGTSSSPCSGPYPGHDKYSTCEWKWYKNPAAWAYLFSTSTSSETF